MSNVKQLVVNEALAKEFGLSEEEYVKVLEIMGRKPSLTELGIFSVMWSEHCSYKSSRAWLRELPTKAPWVIHGPGENAGVVDIGEGLAAIFKMESHNHPSFIEPYQGAATGVGGILRDVFTMGARPVANLNALRFGDPLNPVTKHIVDGVVRGIGGYGNCVGVPTVGGEVNFHKRYNGNPLVNAMTVGVARKDRIFLSAAAGVGNPVIYVGSKTGRDGIHGATMASAEFGEDAASKRPTVQVGDPFVEKLLIEACLELMATDAIIAIQDMGAAGLTSSAVEMAGKGGVGIELNLDHVPQREEGMTAYEMMLSESQERMLMVLRPDRTELAKTIFDKWELDFAVIGTLTNDGCIVVRHKQQTEACIPLKPLADEAPLYKRPTALLPKPKPLGKLEVRESIEASLIQLLACPDLASRSWIWDQYDSNIGGQTVFRPGKADSALIRVDGTKRGLALTTDCTPRYCAADAYQGGAQAVAEAWRNITATGAKPLAITDNLNFGNPEKPEVMGQMVAAIEGMRDACIALDFPVVSGNVSLYNETKDSTGENISVLPSPVIGGLGVIDNIAEAIGNAMLEDCDIVLIGKTEGELGQSLWLREIGKLEAGSPPKVNLQNERKNGDFVRELISNGDIKACHDVSDGGILVSLAEMAMIGDVGCTLETPESGMRPEAYWFGEDQARYIVLSSNGEDILKRAQEKGISARFLGYTGGKNLVLPSGAAITLARMKMASESFFQKLMKDK
ncbi:Phosphoribosylformylglycinamidine synthase subunit PurL [Commensalibacter sp. Nvir]|uniref:phosphoribosylformylglycinamidine synthase subunit PurL n=1 Tax=Commensalibacter sp. Nvir TaxID=3069817 RepID=UPI002D2AC6C6|nr:Phosphoribosylformylglycinamidine synthase subunit PurL [Commensalibacter sp. Nvir]